jgi:hypothetical protein
MDYFNITVLLLELWSQDGYEDTDMLIGWERQRHTEFW